MRILALDVGNTSVAAALFEPTAAGALPRDRERRVRGERDEVEIDHWLAAARASAADRIVVGCVHRFGARLADVLQRELGATVRRFERGSELPLRADVLEPEQVGVDRMAAALAAFTLAGGPALVVNAGTAITADWVDAVPPEPTFRGGAIIPGRRLQARALHEHTDRLPDVPPWGNPPPLALPGRSSEEAIRHGLDVGIPAQVEALLAALRRAAGAAELPLFVSGGDAEWLLARLVSRARAEPFLVARGLALAVERAG